MMKACKLAPIVALEAWKPTFGIKQKLAFCDCGYVYVGEGACSQISQPQSKFD